MHTFLPMVALAAFALAGGAAHADEFCSTGSYEGRNYLAGAAAKAHGEYLSMTARMPPQQRREADALWPTVVENVGRQSNGGPWTSPQAREAYAKCRPGDIIFIPMSAKAVVAILCDFTRTITTVGENVLCVKIEERGVH